MDSSKCIFIFLSIFFFISFQETNGLKSALKKSGSNQGRRVVFNPETEVAVIPDKIDANFVAPVESILDVHKELLKPGKDDSIYPKRKPSFDHMGMQPNYDTEGYYVQNPQPLPQPYRKPKEIQQPYPNNMMPQYRRSGEDYTSRENYRSSGSYQQRQQAYPKKFIDMKDYYKSVEDLAAKEIERSERRMANYA
ncbi:hypothetical protein T4B_13956 [Trichinella pseudospiralis]|uniref:Uncharacterized protein n=2 Tax=Trichinella pseudospiralis TaxID=6337 RepID=A0A0V1IYL1_TRIPS|nr:hypothetical protein T4A_13090 [Trichinella pseudospiralis]KRZ27796.1 hypothetical protein T4B_13956 [Trichinella pseudospiralis]KRZ39248.1 hypothetical protein T4C_10423 [Trichinella pseudospiralis]